MYQNFNLESLNMGKIQAAIVRTVHNATNAAVFYSNSFIYSLRFSQLLEKETPILWGLSFPVVRDNNSYDQPPMLIFFSTVLIDKMVEIIIFLQ